jgi:voltage-gated potassium channel
MQDDASTLHRESPAKLEVWDERSKPLVAVAALAPFIALAIIPDDLSAAFIVIDVVSWSVFLVDFVVRVVIWRKYPSTGNGIFDLSIVLLTFPWYIFPVASSARFLSTFRIARLIKVMVSTKVMRRTAAVAVRFGALGIWILGASLFSALVVLNVEPASSGFEDFWDAIWWSVVSFTTVGYGDLYPVTGLGRFAGLIMMLTGLAALGSVAAILGSTFSSADDDATAEELSGVLEELQALRGQVAELTQLVASSQHSADTKLTKDER